MLQSYEGIAHGTAQLFGESVVKKELEQSKMDSITDVLHELHTSLHSIQGFVRLILEGRVPDHETQREFLAIIEKQSQHLDNLADDLLNALALESGRETIKSGPVSMKDVTLDTILKLGGLAAEKKISIDTDLDAHLPPVQGDVQALGQVVTNLLHNAVKFSPRGSKITIRVSGQDGKLLTQVTDQGTGIPRESVPCLFEKFYRAHTPVTRAVRGLGLGLYLCKQIVEAHGGQIWVDSEPDRGSIFSFTIPLASTRVRN